MQAVRQKVNVAIRQHFKLLNYLNELLHTGKDGKKAHHLSSNGGTRPNGSI
jgi:hypothetical protein